MGLWVTGIPEGPKLIPIRHGCARELRGAVGKARVEAPAACSFLGETAKRDWVEIGDKQRQKPSIADSPVWRIRFFTGRSTAGAIHRVGDRIGVVRR